MERLITTQTGDIYIQKIQAQKIELVVGRKSERIILQLNKRELNSFIENFIKIGTKIGIFDEILKQNLTQKIVILHSTVEPYETSLKNDDYKLVVTNLLSNPEANLYISLPQHELSLFSIELIQNACGDFMEALGFELKTQTEPVFGSFFQSILYFLKSKKTEEEIADLYDKGKQALEASYLNLPTAEASAKMAEAASKVIVALDNIDEAAIRLGAIILLKVKIGSKTTIITETVSPKLATILDSMPNILMNPNAVYNLLQTDKMQYNVFSQSEDVQVRE